MPKKKDTAAQLFDVRDKSGNQADAELQKKISEIHDKAMMELKEKLIELADQYPEEYRVAALNIMSIELIASALSATINATGRAGEKDKAQKEEAENMAKSVFEMFSEGVMPLFIELGIKTKAANIRQVDGDLPSELGAILLGDRSNEDGENNYTLN